MKRRRFLFIAAAAAFGGPVRAEITTWQADMLGGTVRIDLRGPRALSADVVRNVGATIAEVEAAASLFKPASALSRLNAAGRLDEPPAALLDLCGLADDLYRRTDGRFDPTVQPLWRALALVAWQPCCLRSDADTAPTGVMASTGQARHRGENNPGCGTVGTHTSATVGVRSILFKSISGGATT